MFVIFCMNVLDSSLLIPSFTLNNLSIVTTISGVTSLINSAFQCKFYCNILVVSSDIFVSNSSDFEMTPTVSMFDTIVSPSSTMDSSYSSFYTVESFSIATLTESSSITSVLDLSSVTMNVTTISLDNLSITSTERTSTDSMTSIISLWSLYQSNIFNATSISTGNSPCYIILDVYLLVYIRYRIVYFHCL